MLASNFLSIIRRKGRKKQLIEIIKNFKNVIFLPSSLKLKERVEKDYEILKSKLLSGLEILPFRLFFLQKVEISYK